MSRTRREFLRTMLAAPIGGMLGASPPVQASEERKLHLNTFSIAGFRYYDGNRATSLLKPGEWLRLSPEPENRHDSFAVEIFADPWKLGYVPRSDNRHISRLLQQGARLTCEIVETESWRGHIDTVRVAVYLISPAPESNLVETV